MNNKVTYLYPSVDSILESAKEQNYKELVMIGVDENTGLHYISSTSEITQVNFWLDCYKAFLMRHFAIANAEGE